MPKVFFPDRDGALIKCLEEVDMIFCNGVLSRESERGITFVTFPSQGHEKHGNIEAKIKAIQQPMERSGITNRRLHTMG